MGRRIRIFTDQFPYHVNCRSNNKEWFSVDPQSCWNVFTLNLRKVQIQYDFKVHAFVLMSNHYHLLCSTGREHNLGYVMNRFQTEAARDLNGISGKINHIFGCRYHSTLITEARYYMNALKYAYRNPVKINGVNEISDHEYSTYPSQFNHGQSKILLSEPEKFKLLDYFSESSRIINWLNTPTSKENDDLIKKGLRRSVFKIAINKKYSKDDVLKSFFV